MNSTVSRRSFIRAAGLGLAGLSVGLAACQPAAPTAPAAAPATAPAQKAAAPAQPAAGQLEKARVAFWSQPISEEANVFAAQELGMWKDEGLDFEFIPGAGGGDAIKNLLAGNAELAFGVVEATMFSIDQGAKLKVIYNVYPTNGFNLVSLQKNPITRMEQVKGKKVGVYSMASGTRYNLMVMLRSAGLKESDLEIIATGVGNFGPLIEGQVVAIAATDAGLKNAQLRGLPEVSVLWAKDFLNTPMDIFVVTEEAFNTRKEYLRRFLRAYKKSVEYMMANPEKTADIATKYAIDGKDPAINLEIIKLRNDLSWDEGTRKNGLGWFNLDTMKKIAQTYFDLGLIKNRINVEDVFTNELLPK